MSLETVREWLDEHASDLQIIEVKESTATVETAARALHVEPGRIAKTLAVRAGDHLFLLVTPATRGSTTGSAKTSSERGRGCLEPRKRWTSQAIQSAA